MKAFSFDDIVRSFHAWRKNLPAWPYWLIAIVLTGIAFLAGGLEGIVRLCEQIVKDLGHLQPFGIIEIYYRELPPCSPYLAAWECVAFSALGLFNPSTAFGNLFRTMGEIWSSSGVPGRIILPLSFVGAFPLAVELIDRLFRKLFRSKVPGLVVFVFAALLTPFVASVIALVLQGLAIVLFWVLGAIVGLIVWIQVTLAGVWIALERFKQLLGLAKHSEAAVKTAGGLLGAPEGAPSPPPPPATP